jgi:hypothetical protein
MIYRLPFYFSAFLTGRFPIHEPREAALDSGAIRVNSAAKYLAVGEVGGFFRGTAEKILGSGGHRVVPESFKEIGSLGEFDVRASI